MLLDLILGLAPWLAGQVADGKAATVTKIGTQIFKEALGTDDPTAIEAALANPANAEAVKARLELLRARSMRKARWRWLRPREAGGGMPGGRPSRGSW